MAESLIPEQVVVLAEQVAQILSAQSQGVGEVTKVTSLDGVFSLPVLLFTGTDEIVVEAPLSLLRVWIQRGSNAIQWKQGDAGEWQNLISIPDLTGPKGETPEFRTGSTGIEWKYTIEDGTAWRPLVPIDQLKLTFDMLTASQKEAIRGYSAFQLWQQEEGNTDKTMDDYLAWLRQPATEAAKTAGDKMAQIVSDVSLLKTGFVEDSDKLKQTFVYSSSELITDFQTVSGKLITDTNTAKDAAITAAETANTASGLADSAASTANTAKDNANTAAGRVDTAIAAAEDATNMANTAAAMAIEGADKATTAAELANTKARLADTAADRANTAAQAAENVVSGIRPDWSVNDPTSGNYIANKPDIPDWALMPESPDSFPEAPKGEKTYGRKNGAWSEVVALEDGKGLSANNYTDADKEKLGKINLTPTLDHEPGGDDLTFADADGEHTFLIGNQARAMDPEKGEYVFWQLYDVTPDKAIWKKAGGNIELSEKLAITLTSNQAQPDVNLYGLIVHVKHEDNDTQLIWNGTIMTTEIPMNMTYTIEYPDCDGYSVPEIGKYMALAGNTRTVESVYNTTILTIDIASNQADKTDLNDLQITLFGSRNKIMTYSGQPLVVHIPIGEEIVITPAQIEGYATVATITKTPVASVDTVSFTYNTTIMNIILTSNQGTDATLDAGTNVMVECGNINKTLTWNGLMLIQKIPTGQTYTIKPAALTGYKTPTAKTGIATGVNMSESMQYQTELVTVTVNTDNSASCSGQNITINGAEYAYNNPIAVKIPFGTSYSVSVNSKAGFTSPDAQSFTANQAIRDITMTYLEIIIGVFILDTNGRLVKRIDWNTSNNSKAVGVAVLSYNCKFVIDPTETNSAEWGRYAFIINDIVTTDNRSIAVMDYKGNENTYKIYNQTGTEVAYSYNICRRAIFKHGKGGYLGALGEWVEVYNNMAEINVCMSLIGGDPLNSRADVYWSSTQHGQSTAWLYNFTKGEVEPCSKDNNAICRAFSPL